jgi:hypothetical protein
MFVLEEKECSYFSFAKAVAKILFLDAGTGSLSAICTQVECNMRA